MKVNSRTTPRNGIASRFLLLTANTKDGSVRNPRCSEGETLRLGVISYFMGNSPQRNQRFPVKYVESVSVGLAHVRTRRKASAESATSGVSK